MILTQMSEKEAKDIQAIYRPDPSTPGQFPVAEPRIAAGFPSPAEDFMEGKLDLNEHLIKHPAATFFVRVTGDSMVRAGIHSGDLLVVDRALEPTDSKIVIAILNGELTVKRIQRKHHQVFLIPENKHYKPIEVTEDMDFEIWGVVTTVIHSV